MLSEKQIHQLQNLLENCSSKYKFLFKRTFSKWISGEIKPIVFDFGVSVKNGIFIPTKNKNCCLLGTALIGLKKQKLLFML